MLYDLPHIAPLGKARDRFGIQVCGLSAAELLHVAHNDHGETPCLHRQKGGQRGESSQRLLFQNV